MYLTARYYSLYLRRKSLLKSAFFSVSIPYLKEFRRYQLYHEVVSWPAIDLFLRANPSLTAQAAMFWRPVLLQLWNSSSSDEEGGEFIALIWSMRLPSVGFLAYLSSMKSSSWSSYLFSVVPFSLNQSLKSSRIASSTAFMLRPGEQIVTEGNVRSDTGLAGSCVIFEAGQLAFWISADFNHLEGGNGQVSLPIWIVDCRQIDGNAKADEGCSWEFGIVKKYLLVYPKTSQDLRMLSRSLSVYKSLILNVMSFAICQ